MTADPPPNVSIGTPEPAFSSSVPTLRDPTL
jgi:hypothetical protein